MAVTETTTVRVRQATQRRLAREAELAGTSVVDVLDAAADLLEEQRLLADMDRAYGARGDAISAESGAWETTLSDGLADKR